MICACDKHDDSSISIRIDLESGQDYNYKYDDVYINYEIQGDDNKTFALKCLLLDDSDKEIYSTEFIDTLIFQNSIEDKVNLAKLDWQNNSVHVDFYEILNKQYYLQFCLYDYNSKKIDYLSNKVDIEINKENPDTSLIDNFILFDINNLEYELIKQLEYVDYVFFFDFAVWCGWSIKSIPIVQQIDSIYDKRVSVLGVEGSSADYLANIDINKFIADNNMTYPIFYRVDNLILNKILHPDNSLGFPRFLLINKERKVVYRQIGYSEYLMDSVRTYIGQN